MSKCSPKYFNCFSWERRRLGRKTGFKNNTKVTIRKGILQIKIGYMVGTSRGPM